MCKSNKNSFEHFLYSKILNSKVCVCVYTRQHQIDKRGRAFEIIRETSKRNAPTPSQSPPPPPQPFIFQSLTCKMDSIDHILTCSLKKLLFNQKVDNIENRNRMSKVKSRVKRRLTNNRVQNTCTSER